MAKYKGTVGELRKLLDTADDDDLVLVEFRENEYKKAYPDFVTVVKGKNLDKGEPVYQPESGEIGARGETIFAIIMRPL